MTRQVTYIAFFSVFCNYGSVAVKFNIQCFDNVTVALASGCPGKDAIKLVVYVCLTILIPVITKRVHSFQSHPSYVSTLPENTLTSEKLFCLLTNVRGSANSRLFGRI